MFGRFVDDGVGSVIVVYVDDGLLTSKPKEDEERTLSDLRSCFNIKNLGEAEFYLEDIIQHRMLSFDQRVYAETLAKQFNASKTSIKPTVIRAKAF